MAYVHADRMQMYEHRNLNWASNVDIPLNPIIINTWYTALDAVRNVKGVYLLIEQTNAGAAIETIEVDLIIDGVSVIGATIGVASGVGMYVYLSFGALFFTATARPMRSLNDDQSPVLETRELSIRIRQTTAVDLVSAILDVDFIYATKEFS